MIKSNHALFTSLIFLFPVTSTATSMSEKAGAIQLTVYNQDFALVKETRHIKLSKGDNQITLIGVAALLDPTSVLLRPLSQGHSMDILEQNFQFDLINYNELLQNYIGKEVEIHQTTKSGEVRIKKARLLSTGASYQPQVTNYSARINYRSGQYGTPLYEMDGKLFSNPGGQVVLPVPNDFITEPTLQWLADSNKSGDLQVELSYITQGVRWQADYVALLDEKDKHLDLTGWVTLDNRSGKRYENAALKIVAGDVNKLSPDAGLRQAASRPLLRSGVSADSGFEEKPFFEYHLYTLQRSTTLNDNEIKQIEFTSAKGVSVTKKYVYDGQIIPRRFRNSDFYTFRERPEYGKESQSKVWIMMEFNNSKRNNLGIPLPKGRIRLYKRDTDKGQELVGEDLIDHTPEDEKVSLYAGNAFDVVGERTQLDFKVIQSNHIVDETIEITIRNHKKQSVVVDVLEHLNRSQQWEIRGQSHKHNKLDAANIEFPIQVAAGGTEKVTYTVRYSW